MRIPDFEPVAELPPKGSSANGHPRRHNLQGLIAVIERTHPDTWCRVDLPGSKDNVYSVLRKYGAEVASRQGEVFVRVPCREAGAE